MCYSNSSTSTTTQLAERYQKLKLIAAPDLQYYFASGFHFPRWNIITNDESLQQMRWGLLPNWFKGANWKEFASKTLNARIETCTEKASFKHLINSKRCLVPSSGFFEWQTAGKLKIPYFIADPKQAIFSIAGIYDSWLDHATGAIENTFTIFTTEANPLMAEIHNTKKRMPLILATNEEDSWLAGKLSLENIMDRSAIQLEAWEVDKRIILSSNANISMVSQRYQNPQGIQKGLFD